MQRIVAIVALGLMSATAAHGAQEAQPPGKASRPPYTVIDGTRVDAATYRGWQIVRELDCARCHGSDFRGRVAPSLVESARERSRSGFQYYVLEGMPMRGMPGYKGYEKVRDNIDGIYAYFKGLADGAIQTGALSRISDDAVSQQEGHAPVLE